MAEPVPGSRRGADPAAVVAGYECLRERVLTGRPDGWRFGHAVLAGRGIAAWMAAWAALSPSAPQATTGPDPSAPSTQFLSTSISPSPPAALSSLPRAAAIVAVLAQMALAHA